MQQGFETVLCSNFSIVGLVEECNNEPPTLDIPNEEICVVAGELIEFDVVAGAPLTDEDQLVLLEANGRPFELDENT